MSYNFEIDGENFEIPSFNEIPTGAIRKARRAADEMDRAFTILEEAIGVDTPAIAALDKLTVDEFAKWLDGWTSGVSLGESSSSEN